MSTFEEIVEGIELEIPYDTCPKCMKKLHAYLMGTLWCGICGYSVPGGKHGSDAV